MDLENSMAPSQLVEIGRRALAAVSTGVAGGAPLVKCQLLASEFYEALKRELRQTSSANEPKHAMLIAAAKRCERVAITNIGPSAVLREVGNALAMLQSDAATPPARSRSRPVLRVIEGGLSRV
jgi:hypothetical protein